MSLHGRSGARVSLVHVQGWPEDKHKELLIDGGMADGSLVHIWSDQRRAWMRCRVLPHGQRWAYIAYVKMAPELPSTDDDLA